MDTSPAQLVVKWTLVGCDWWSNGHCIFDCTTVVQSTCTQNDTSSGYLVHKMILVGWSILVILTSIDEYGTLVMCVCVRLLTMFPLKSPPAIVPSRWRFSL